MLESGFTLKDMVVELVNKDNQIMALGQSLIDQEEQFNKDRNSCWWSGFLMCGILVGFAAFVWKVLKKESKTDRFEDFDKED